VTLSHQWCLTGTFQWLNENVWWTLLGQRELRSFSVPYSATVKVDHSHQTRFSILYQNLLGMYSATSFVGLLGCVAATSEFTANNVRDKWVCTNNGNINVSSTRAARDSVVHFSHAFPGTTECTFFVHPRINTSSSQLSGLQSDFSRVESSWAHYSSDLSSVQFSLVGSRQWSWVIPNGTMAVWRPFGGEYTTKWYNGCLTVSHCTLSRGNGHW